MRRNLTLGIGGLVAVLLFCSDASACHRRRASCSVPTSNSCGSAYGGYGGSGYGYGGAGYGGGYGGGYDYGRPGYNPGGLGGPASGLGVRPGAGFGGFGPRR